jgi:hypothetical protein
MAMSEREEILHDRLLTQNVLLSYTYNEEERNKIITQIEEIECKLASLQKYGMEPSL